MFTLNCKGRLLVVDKPLVMGIINTTPDSFYEGSRTISIEQIIEKASEMVFEGADILDIGGQSTRPNSKKISVDEELKRILPGIEKIHKLFPETIISIDTFYAKVAKEAVQAGASIVNDISAGKMDEAMIETVAALRVPYVLMHMQGTPQAMQQNPVYKDVTKEILDFFIMQTQLLKQAGIKDIIIDPGFGFGKTVQHNFELLRHFDLFKMLNYPLLAGLSRKSHIYKTLGIDVSDALNGTTVLNTISLLKGANILRVHDVKEARETITLLQTVFPGE
ncbi:MAG TPA: dihydropteroate synthase [Chitinophagaceae bacterium]